jgi:hypothetical protein
MDSTATVTEGLFAQFEAYRKVTDLLRVRLNAVPENMRPLVVKYRQALSAQLDDPENQSWDSLGPNERYNALLAVKRVCSTPTFKTLPQGNCPRCGGTGRLLAYLHIMGGVCLRCGGSGNVKVL